MNVLPIVETIIPLCALLAGLVIWRSRHNTTRMDANGVPPIRTIVEPDITKADSAIAEGWKTLRDQPPGAYAEVKVKTGEENHTLRVWKAKPIARAAE